MRHWKCLHRAKQNKKKKKKHRKSRNVKIAND